MPIVNNDFASLLEMLGDQDRAIGPTRTLKVLRETYADNLIWRRAVRSFLEGIPDTVEGVPNTGPSDRDERVMKHLEAVFGRIDAENIPDLHPQADLQSG